MKVCLFKFVSGANVPAVVMVSVYRVAVDHQYNAPAFTFLRDGVCEMFPMFADFLLVCAGRVAGFYAVPCAVDKQRGVAACVHV
jgi:hypothetical protein